MPASNGWLERHVTERAANRYGLVVALLVATYAVSATYDDWQAARLMLMLQLLVLWLVFAVSGSRRARRLASIAIVVAVAAVAVSTAIAPGEPGRETQIFFGLLIALLYAISPFVVIREVLQRPGVDAQTLLGAIASFTLIGMTFAATYRVVSLIQVDVPFFGADGAGTTSDFLFFSFITMTTVGYGDLVPATNPGQGLAVAEAIIGQLFLVTAVAKIVSVWQIPAQNHRDET